MSEWSHIRRYNPSGPDYPEAGRDYVLRSEAEEKVEAAEAKLRAVAELPRFDVEYGGDEIGLYRVPTELGDYVDADELEALLKK